MRIEGKYYIYRSLIRVSITKARNKGVLELDITTANRCRNTKITGGIRATKKVVEHYSQIQMLLPRLLRYSQELVYPGGSFDYNPEYGTRYCTNIKRKACE